MYTSYFGLKENPFNLTPDPRYLFLSRKHQEALSHLRYGIKERKGFILITGKIGTGKTTLLRSLLADLDRNVKTALIFNAYISDEEILHEINHEFGIPSDEHLSNKQCIDILNDFLLSCYQKGENAVLFLDEAQNLSTKVLEQIRMLSNLETEKEKLLQIIMVGQSELKDILHSSDLRQLDERIAVRYDLDTLEKKDVRSYVVHRLAVADAKGTIHFTRWAFRALYKASKGNPRLINSICDRSLLIAYSRDRFTINREIIRQAALNVKGQRFIYSTSHNNPFRRLMYVSILFILTASAFVSGWYFQNKWFSDVVQTVLNIKQIVLNIEPANVSNPLENLLNPPPETSIAEQAESPMSLSKTEETVETSNETKCITPVVQLSETSENQTATSLIAQMTCVTGDIVLSKTDFEAITKTELSQTMMYSTGITRNEQLSKTDLELAAQPESNAISEAKNISMVSQSNQHHLTETNQKETLAISNQPLEFTTFKPFLQKDEKQKTIQLKMETVVPEDLVQEEQSQKMETLSFFLGEPWEQGMTAPEIMWVQKTLNDAGYPVSVNGAYNKETVEAIKHLQADFGLDVDGIIGPQSKWALYQLSTTRLKDFEK